MIKAFLFDVDGVLTPSADVSAALVSRYFASKSLSIKEDEVVPFMGKGMKALLEESAKYLNTEISLDEALSFFRENYSKELKERKPKEKAREFVLSARSKGIKIAIVSSAPSWRVEENLKYMNLSPGDLSSHPCSTFPKWLSQVAQDFSTSSKQDVTHPTRTLDKDLTQYSNQKQHSLLYTFQTWHCKYLFMS